MSAPPTRVLAPNPSVFTGRGTNAYLLGGSSLVCIDRVPQTPGTWSRFLTPPGGRGGRITTIVLTHSHPDHRPLARRLAENTGAAAHCFDPAAGDEHAQKLSDGDVVRIDDIELVAVYTPGHTATTSASSIPRREPSTPAITSSTAPRRWFTR